MYDRSELIPLMDHMKDLMRDLSDEESAAVLADVARYFPDRAYMESREIVGLKVWKKVIQLLASIS